jgi:hypothetical protein
MVALTTLSSKFFAIVMLSLTFLTADCATQASPELTESAPQTYYFSAESGSDLNTGTTQESPWKSLSKIQDLSLKPGDQILLSAGQTFREPILLNTVFGSKNQPILISTYGGSVGEKATINTVGHLNAVHIKNSSFVEIEHLSISAGADPEVPIEVRGSELMRIGVRVETTLSGTFEHIYLTNLDINNVFYEKEGFNRGSNEVTTANGTQSYGWGIRFFSTSQSGALKHIKIDSVNIENVAHTGIKFTGFKNGDNYGIRDIEITNTNVQRTGGPGIQMSGVFDGHIHGNSVDRSGSDDDSRKWGRGSGLWTWSAANILIEKNSFTNANGPGDSAGAHIDFNCRNIVVQYNFSANNAGGFCEILGNNYNCSYRYNISVNDGHRVKGENGAFQEGKIFWLSGYNGSNNPRRGPYNSYFYNNTMYVKDAIQAKVAIDRMAEGIYMANNIFHIEGDAIPVKGDQYQPETDGEIIGSEVFFKNNLFLHANSWPDSYHWQDTAPLFGDAQFRNAGGLEPSDYIPMQEDLIKDKGITITGLPNDPIGVYLGLTIEHDFFGNPIVGNPDIGAIEID